MEKIPVLYEDIHIVAINKPAGVMSHGDGRNAYPTVSDWFAEYCPSAARVGEDPIETQEGTVITRGGIVHRLDRDTSGVMLLAKTSEGHAHLKEQFQNRSITKTYRAVVYGAMKQDVYTVESPIGRSKNFGRWTAISKAVRGQARSAETHIQVLERLEGDPGYSVVEARPKTGRTHQIRVHMQYLNHPIVADPLYAGKRNDEKHNLGFTRQALHAHQIEFVDLEGTRQVVTAELPEEFTKPM